jgi:HD-like signal output (HDOD) protein/ActR/RegA family two-component response regulator
MKSRILFVDDEVRVLQGLQRMLRPLRDEWEMEFVESGPQALEVMDARPVEVVVSDMRMPGMTGADLLEIVKARHPDVVRLILSGQSSEEAVLKSVGPAHQFLAKPCDANLLKATIRRACGLRDLLADPKMVRLVSQVGRLPSPPDLYVRLVGELRSANPSLRRVAEIVASDVGMTAKVLQMVNSAFFGFRRHISEPQHAVSLLGLTIITSLVLSVQVFTQYDGAKIRAVHLAGLMDHSLAVATLARAIADAERQPQGMLDNALIAGLLHDAGKLVLAVRLHTEYRRVVESCAAAGGHVWEAERAAFGSAHAEIGAYLLGLWALPHAIVEAVAYHHIPRACAHTGFAALTAVHVADTLVHDAEHPGRSDVDMPYLAAVGLTDRLPAWRALGTSRVLAAAGGWAAH